MVRNGDTMRNQLSTLALLLLAGCAITGCSKSDSAAPPAAPTIAPQVVAPAPNKLDNLALFNGKAPEGLVADATIGQSIRSVVPQSQFKCLSETFNYMPDLVLEGDGSLLATLSGSRAENWLMAYLSVNPSGLIDVVLRCPAEQQQMSDAPFLYFTNRKLTDPAPKPVQDWFYVVGQESDLIKVSDSQVTNDIKFPDFMKGMLVNAANPKPNAPVAQSPTASMVVQGGGIHASGSDIGGTWKCGNDRAGGASLVKFLDNGKLEWIDDPGTQGESPRLGKYGLSGTMLSIQITQLPNLARLGRSASVSIKEGGEIKSLNQTDLKFSWWQESEPSDKLSFNCKRQATVAQAIPLPAPPISREAANAIQRNNEIRGNAMSQKCQMLRNAFGDTPVGQYQLEKAGCI